MKLKILYIVMGLVITGIESRAQGSIDSTGQKMVLTLEQVVKMARLYSPDAMAARHTFISAYWNYRSFRANYLPSVSLSSDPELTRTISKVTLPDGTDKYVPQNMLTVDGAVTVKQNVPFTGGSFFVESAIQRMKLFDSKAISYRTSPIVVGYTQSLFGYNSLKWDKRIEPVRYREARKAYVESLELVAADAAL